VGLKRLLLLVVFAVATSLTLVSAAPAGDFDDSVCPAIDGTDTHLCPGGRAGDAYSFKFKLKEGSGCGPGSEIFKVTSGGFPPGLTLASEGNVSGTPTQAGTFDFYVTVSYTCPTPPSDRRFRIVIAPAIPRLQLQTPAVPISTVGVPFTMQMGSSLPDAKAWSFVEGLGTPPPGLQIGATDGVISGTPTTAGTYSFGVSAVLTSDPLVSPPRSDQTTLQIVVRDPVVVSASAPLAQATKWEVGAPFDAALTATGGTATTYTWALAAGGVLPAGLALGTDGTLTGTPRTAGLTRFTVVATDAEGRTGNFAVVFNVAQRLALATKKLPRGKVGRRYKIKLRTMGGVLPRVIRVTTGPLPKGIRYNRATGVLAGKPTKAGSYRITVEATDELGVTATKSYRILVAATPVKKKKKR
jgi:hypothetical protein